MRNKPLEGKVALVTGAGSPKGLGYNMTEALIEAGGRVAMMDVHKEWLEQSSNDLLERFGDDCLITLPLDVSDPHDAETAVMATIGAMGGLHILINNAGTNAHKWGAAGDNFWDISPEIWSKVLSINLNGPFFMAQAAVVHMAEQGWGRIIGVTTSLDTMIRNAPYGPSKAAHEAFVAAMARDLEGTGVTANVLIPGGGTNTNFGGPNPQGDRSGRLEPEVMQAPAVWLASGESGASNGRRIIANFWDESLPIAERLEKASAPAAWPQLGRALGQEGR